MLHHLASATIQVANLVNYNCHSQKDCNKNRFPHDTINPEIFARILFSRNFAYAKFLENKFLTKLRNQSVVY